MGPKSSEHALRRARLLLKQVASHLSVARLSDGALAALAVLGSFGCSGSLWADLAYFWGILTALGCSGQFSGPLWCSGLLRIDLGSCGCFRVFWAALGCSGLLWAASGCSGLIWTPLSELLWSGLAPLSALGCPE